MVNPKIAGALYDFMGYLTTRDSDIVVGKHAVVYPIMDAFKDWAYDRGLDIDHADVRNWSIGEAMIEAVLLELDRLKAGVKGFVHKQVNGLIGRYGIVRNRWVKPTIYSVTLTSGDDVPKFTDEVVDAIIQKFGDAPQVELVKAWVPETYKKSKMKNAVVRGAVSGGKVAISYKRVGIAPEPVKQDQPFYELELQFTGPSFTEKLY